MWLVWLKDQDWAGDGAGSNSLSKFLCGVLSPSTIQRHLDSLEIKLLMGVNVRVKRVCQVKSVYLLKHILKTTGIDFKCFSFVIDKKGFSTFRVLDIDL